MPNSVACLSGVNKIHEIGSLVKAGARTNKYRILHPDFHDEVDILCNASTMPGREIGSVEVYLKGRKYQMAGDMSDENTWNFTIYNTETFLVRDFFLSLIAEIQSFEAPPTLSGSASVLYPRKGQPWYMRNITIQQLGSAGEVLTSAVLTNAYVTTVGPIEYSDETGNISTTEITFTFSGIIYQGVNGKY